MLIIYALTAILVIAPVSVALAARPANLSALNNGLALTPPMGWNSWNIFHENINETQIKQIADAMVSSGMKDAGYIYLNLDDNWMATSRDANGNLRADPTRFPSGMKALGDYIHSKGLKFGIYGDRGLRTCYHYYSGPAGSQSGSYGNEVRDANTFASWGVDYLKYDNCDPAPGSNMQTDYTNMKNALAATGRSIVYSICAWQYQSWMPATGNLWRTTGDISNSWSSMIGLYNSNVALYASAGPGAWNDPDMLEVGNGGMTDTEYRTHMSLWAIMAAPLIAGNDIRSMSQATKDILMAPEIIAIDQDPLGKQGQKISDSGDLEIISKQLSGTNVRAVALLNRGASAANITVTWSQLGLPSGNATVRDLWARVDRGTFNNSYTVSVPSHGTVMLKIVSASSGPTPTAGPSSSVEAETGALSGAAVIASCASCSGGSAVGYIGNGTANYVTLTVNAGASGNQSLTIYGLVSGTRSFSVSVNGGPAQVVSMTGTSWTTPFAASPITVALNAGSNTIRFYNDSAYAPDLDRIVVSNLTNPTATPTNTPPPSGGNLLTNADMESGTTNWVVNGSGTLSSDTSQFHGGTHSIKITGRTSAWNGIGQNVSTSYFPTSGQDYTVSVWVRSESGTPNAKATVRLTADTTTYVNLATAAINSNGWTLVTGTVPVSWSGTLTGVLFYVETDAGTDNIYIDDASLTVAGSSPTPTPGNPTATPTRTNTPTSGPTATPTNTPSIPTNTPSSPTNTPVPSTPTSTPTSGGGTTCSPVTSTISAPFTYDGAGTFCWQSNNLGSYINSWNLTSLTINGTNFTNIWVGSGSYPAQIGGYWYVSYNGPYAWSHFEAK